MKLLFLISVLMISNVHAGVSQLTKDDCSKNTFTGINLVNARFSSPGGDLKGEYTRLSHNALMLSEYAEMKLWFYIKDMQFRVIALVKSFLGGLDKCKTSL